MFNELIKKLKSIPTIRRVSPSGCACLCST